MMMTNRSSSLLERILFFRSFDFGRMRHDTTSQQQQCIVPGTTECCCRTKTASSACRDRAHRPRLHRSVFASTWSFSRACYVRAIPNLQRNERSRRTFIAWIFYHVPGTIFVRKCNEYLVSLTIFECSLCSRTEVCNRI